ncbi:MAG: enterochelin esterase [Gemmatimonadetes bacterium]|nr:enterochelin esterase [Gemmatimonadota bacterium]
MDQLETEVGTIDPRGLAIGELIFGNVPTDGEIEAFLDGRDVPLVEGTKVTFVFRGDLDAVALRHWVYGLPTAVPLVRVPGTDLWYHIIDLPEGSRVEYKFQVTKGQETRLVPDPFNQRLARDPFGANSVCHAAGYEVPDWIHDDPSVRKGTVEDRLFQSRALGGARQIKLYKPARYRETRRYPLLVVHDGSEYDRYANLTTVLDNLIHRRDIPGLVVAMTEPPNRIEQYRDSEEHARYIAEELVPSLESELPLVGEPSGRGLMGASLGAVASLSTAIRYPDTFGRLILQSGSFAFSDIGNHDRGPVFDPIAEMVNRYRADPFPVSERVFVSCGVHESLIYENRSLVPVLERTGMDVRYVEARDGHNWENWRDRLRQGLAFLFPGPQWWVYL